MPKVAIVQFDDRRTDALGPLNVLAARNALYAQKHGYTHEFLRFPDQDMPPFWNKVFLVEKFLNAGHDIVAWLDSDAVIHDFNCPIESFFPGDEGFVFSTDLPIWQAVSPINAGVFFARGGFGRAVMADWKSLYPAHLWKKQNGAWNYNDHVWAGPAYEQGIFADHLFPKYRSNPAFRQISWKRLQSPYPLPESFSLHFPSRLRTNCLLYLRQLAENT